MNLDQTSMKQLEPNVSEDEYFHSIWKRVKIVDHFDDSDVFTVGDIRYRLVWSDFHKYKTTEDEIVILKSWPFLIGEAKALARLKPVNLLELGFFQGGSSFLWHQLFGCKYVGVDFLPYNESIVRAVNKYGFENDIHLYFSSSQADKERLLQILKRSFGDQLIDVVIDDASHQYEESRRSFEILFPMLNNGGAYVLEDWAWAHIENDMWQKEKFWGDKHALTNLVFEIVMLLGSKSYWISDFNLTPWYGILYKNIDCPAIDEFNLTDSYAKQDRVFQPI
jgi:cephalosporin hydroxylase